MEELRQFLIDNPLELRTLCKKLGIPTKIKRKSRPITRMVDSWQSCGFDVVVEVDDDELSEEERKAHYGDLADKCIKALKSKGGLKRG